MPDSSDPENEFDAQYEAFLAWQKNELQPKANAQAQGVYDNTVLVEQALEGANEASDAAGDAAAAAMTAAASAINAPGTQATSVTSVALGTGTKVFTLQQTGKLFPVGGRVFFADPTAPTTRRAVGTVTANDPDAPTLTVNVTNAGDVTGSGTYSNWIISNAGEGTSLPATTVPDAGKVLGVTSGGVYGLLPQRLAGGAAAAASVTLTVSSAAVQRVVPTTPGVSVTMPLGTTMTAGAAFMIANAGGYDVMLRDSTGALLGFVRPAQTATVGIADISTAAGKWVLSGGSTHGVPASGEVAFALALGASGSIGLRGVVALDNTRELLLFGGDARLYAVVWDSAAGVFGTPVLVRAATFGTAPCIAVKSATDQALVLSCDTTNGLQGVVLSVSGTTVTVGTAAVVSLASNWANPMDLIAVAGQGFAFAYGRATNVQGLRAVTVTGNTVAIGAESAITGTVNGNANPAALFDAGAGKIVVFSTTSTTSLYGQIFTMAATTLTAGTGASTAAGGAGGYYMVRALASGRWGVVYRTTDIVGTVFNLSGTTLTAATPVTLLSGANQFSAAWAKGSQIIVAGDANGTPLLLNVLTDNAGVAVAGTAISRDAGATTSMVGADTDSLWVLNASSNNTTGRVYRVGISGNNPAILNAIPVVSAGQDVGGYPMPTREGSGALTNTPYGRLPLTPGLLQGSQTCMPSDGGGYALSWKFAAGVPLIEPRQPGPVLSAGTFTNQWCRVGNSAQWGSAQSSTTSVIVQKVQVA